MTVGQIARHASGERKQITAMFIDVVDFSSVASTSDAEDLQQWLGAFYAQADRIITAHGGEVTEYLGDGIVAIFGLDRSDELSAGRAVNTAVAAMQDINASHGNGVHMQLRIGIATGEAAVRSADGVGNLPRVTGMVTTLARRVQEAANPGSILIAEDTVALLRENVPVEPDGVYTLKGFSGQQTLYRPSSFADVAVADRPFVGRAVELKRIADSTRPCLIVGEAGMGKTALMRHVANATGPAQFFSADGVNARDSYHPFVQWIVQICGTPNPDMGALKTSFGTLNHDAQFALALVLGLPEGQRLLIEKSNLALKGLIEESLWQAIKAHQPDGLLIFEDLHWMDNASFGVLVRILQADDRTTHRLLMTSREDAKIGQYLGRIDLTTIPLDPLPPDDARAMLAALTGSDAAADADTLIVDQAAGVPLFIEQLQKRRDRGSAADAVPGSLMDLLAAQIDASGDSKQVLQCAAVIGREFGTDMLGAIAGGDADLGEKLQSACATGVLRQTGSKQFRFAHALLQQVASQGMLRQIRAAYHGKAAAYLQDHASESVRRTPVLLAYHLRHAQHYVPAIQTYLAASQQAMFQGAFADAEAHVQTAITLCTETPAEIDTAALEIASYSALGSIRMQTLGFTAAPVREAFEKVAALAATQNAFSVANGPAFYGSFTHGIVSGDRVAADKFGSLLRAAAKAVPAAETGYELQVASANVDAALHFYTGDFAALFKAAETLRQNYDVTRHGAMIATYGADTFAAAQMFEVAGRSIAGDTHLIADLIAETDAHQALLNIPVMAPWAQIWGAVPLFYAGLQADALARVAKGIETATGQGAIFWQVTGAAWLQVMDPTQSADAPGLSAFEQVIKTHEGLGANIGLPYFRAHYASALARAGQTDAAYQAGQLAVRENAGNGLHCWYPEVLRLQASICLHANRKSEAAQHLAEAAALAERQGSGLWLLRTRIDQFRAGLIDGDRLEAAGIAAPTTPEAATVPQLLADA
ncbi:MAG: adenylate/guanylate cyclase domain-containing protein [Pseudomonadota bacterium]